MKRLSFSLGIAALLAIAPLSLDFPALANSPARNNVLAQLLPQRQEQMKLELSAAKKLVETNEDGTTEIVWQELSGQTNVVQPGDVLRYSLVGANPSQRPVANLVVTQPIPERTVYVLNSAAIETGEEASITYSIDGGETFIANPTIEVELEDGTTEERPAPADIYTHVRWEFDDAIRAETDMNVTYQVAVR
ncbi:MAG: hypothetical protein AAF704_11690 [Cyanobacteria bacterium P01_D01_bin.123]